MGWTGTGDGYNGFTLAFDSRDAAVSFCERNGLFLCQRAHVLGFEFDIERESYERKSRDYNIRSYGDKFNYQVCYLTHAYYSG